MSVTLDGPLPYRARADLREAARRDRPRDAPLVGQLDRGRRGARAHGRRRRCAGCYCAQNPSQNLHFGYGPADEVKRRLLTLWNSVGFLVDYANIAGFSRRGRLASRPARSTPLDRWLVARTRALVAEAEAALRALLDAGVTAPSRAFVDDLSNWYIRRSRRALLGRRARGARDALVGARPGAARRSRR